MILRTNFVFKTSEFSSGSKKKPSPTEDWPFFDLGHPLSNRAALDWADRYFLHQKRKEKNIFSIFFRWIFLIFCHSFYEKKEYIHDERNKTGKKGKVNTKFKWFVSVRWGKGNNPWNFRKISFEVNKYYDQMVALILKSHKILENMLTIRLKVANDTKICDPNSPHTFDPNSPHVPLQNWWVQKILTEINYPNCYYS